MPTSAVATKVQVYFCDPRSPWQPCSNENTNGLLRHTSREEPTSRATSRISNAQLGSFRNEGITGIFR